jgi:hypothetical protein
MITTESSSSRALLDKEEAIQTEQNWNLLFKFDPTPEELEMAACIFAATCWQLNSVENLHTVQRKPGSFDIGSGHEVPGEEGDNTWLVTDGEHKAWVTRYGLNRVPLWSANLEDEEDL